MRPGWASKPSTQGGEPPRSRSAVVVREREERSARVCGTGVPRACRADGRCAERADRQRTREPRDHRSRRTGPVVDDGDVDAIARVVLRRECGETCRELLRPIPRRHHHGDRRGSWSRCRASVRAGGGGRAERSVERPPGVAEGAGRRLAIAGCSGRSGASPARRSRASRHHGASRRHPRAARDPSAGRPERAREPRRGSRRHR